MGFFVCGFHVAFITAHMPAFISDLGFEAKVGAWSISIIGRCNVFGAYFSGVVSGKMSMRQAHLNSITTRLLVWLLASCAPPAAVEIFEGSTPFAIR